MSDIDQPLVTFALFSYNQESFIREAVFSAFSQSYQPLEIILSDDCSTDHTFEIMEELVREYKGPHQVRAVQTEKNLGVLEHVLLRGREAKGQIIVVAAGDDLSLSDRVSQHVKAYEADDVFAVSSAYSLIDEDGRVLTDHVDLPINVRNPQRRLTFFKKTRYDYQVIQGSTASYCARLFKLDPRSESSGISEDNWFNFLAYLLGGRVVFLPEAHVKYRRHANALTNNIGYKDIDVEVEEADAMARCKSELQKLVAFRALSGASHKEVVLDVHAIERQERFLADRLDWPRRGAIGRLLSLFLDLCCGHVMAARWKAPRIFGQFPRYQPHSMLRAAKRARNGKS